MSQSKSNVPGVKDPAPFKLTIVVTQDNEEADSDTGDTLHAVCMAWNSSSGQYDIPVVGAQVTFTPADGLLIMPHEPKTRADGTTEDVGAYSDNPGKYKVDASAHGGKPLISGFVNADPVYVHFTSNSQDTTTAMVDVVINPPVAEGKPYTVTAHCYLSPGDGSGAQDPSVGANVTFTGGKNAANLTFLPSASGKTDSTGHFTADVYASVADDYTITATASGGDPEMPPNSTGMTSRMIMPVYALKITPQSGTLYADGYTTAEVTARFSIQPNDEPVQGATVTFDPVDELMFVSAASGLTNQQGEFTALVTCAKDGTYTLTATGAIAKPNSDTDNAAHGQAQIVFVPAPAYQLVLSGKQTPGGTPADGATDVLVTATCLKRETDGTTTYIQGAQINFSGPEELEIVPQSGQTMAGDCMTKVASRTDGKYILNAHAVGGTGSPQLPQKGVDAKGLELIFTPSGEYYFELESDQGKNIPPADGRTPFNLTAYCYYLPLNSQQEQGVRGVEIDFAPVDGLVFSTLSGRTGQSGTVPLAITTTVEGNYTLSATAKIGSQYLPLSATIPIRFGKYDEVVKVGLEFAGGTDIAQIYANGLNQAEVVVHWSIVDTDGIAAIDDVQLVTSDDHTPLEQKGWTIHDDFTDPNYQPGPYTKTLPIKGYENQTTDAATSAKSGSSSTRRSPANKDDPSGTGKYHFYLSTDGKTTVSPQTFCVMLTYRGVTYYSTANDEEDLGSDIITLLSMPQEYYNHQSFHMAGSIGAQSGNDDDNNPGYPQADWLWRQLNCVHTLNNGNEIKYLTVPTGVKSGLPYLYTAKGNNYYWMEVYVWPLDETAPTVHLWEDYGASRSISLPGGPAAINVTIIIVARSLWVSGQSTYFDSTPLTFIDEYGNTGSVYINCDLPNTYSDLYNDIINKPAGGYLPLSDSHNIVNSNWGWISPLQELSKGLYVKWTTDEYHEGVVTSYECQLQSSYEPDYCTFVIGHTLYSAGQALPPDDHCPASSWVIGAYYSTKIGSLFISCSPGLTEKPLHMVTLANSDPPGNHGLGSYQLGITPVWMQNAFRFSIDMEDQGMIYASSNSSYISFNTDYGSENSSFWFKFNNA